MAGLSVVLLCFVSGCFLRASTALAHPLFQQEPLKQFLGEADSSAKSDACSYEHEESGIFGIGFDLSASYG